MAATPTPTVQSAIDCVRQRIRTGDFRPGTVLPSESDLASTFGVSRGTIRRAIEVLIESGELARRPFSRPIVGSLPRSKAETAATEVHVWVSHPIADENTLLFLKGISLGLSGSPYRMVVREPSRFTGAVVRGEERQFFSDLIQNEKIAGAIIQRDVFASDEDVIQQALDFGMSLVFVDSPAPLGIAADYVGTANIAAARRCVEHLLELGHTRIAFVADSSVPLTTQDRLKGFLRSMRQAGIEDQAKTLFADHLEPVDVSNNVFGGTFATALDRNPYFLDMSSRLVSAILQMDPLPTALFVGFDVLAYWVWALLEGAGVRIPSQMSIIGFDWVAGRDKSIPDELTTASQDFAGFGRHAADLLLDRITGQIPSTPRHVLLDAPLVIRSSTIPEFTLPAFDSAKQSMGKGAQVNVYES
ncbi:MAG TPA: GntR family transcriptional regulator [Fimbriimonas sp.]|nr:GntR family transcriptional regulator [Fimbriimonas sp.]